MSKPLHYQIVARARAIIEDGEHWTRDVLAVAKHGTIVEPTDATAERFCAVGALTRAVAEMTADASNPDALASDVHLELLRFVDLPSSATLEAINDSEPGHAAILALFDDYLSVM